MEIMNIFQEINDKINKINPDKINIIDCYSINDKNIEPQRIKENMM